MGYSVAGGKLIHKKNKKQKISWHCPFKTIIVPERQSAWQLQHWSSFPPNNSIQHQ